MSNTSPIRRNSGGGGGGGSGSVRRNRSMDHRPVQGDENDKDNAHHQSSSAAAVSSSSPSPPLPTPTSSPSSSSSSSSSSPSFYCYNNKDRKWIVLIPLTLVWWGASAWNSVDAKRAAKADPNCVSIMAAASNWLGLVFFVILKVRQGLVGTIATATATTNFSRTTTTTATTSSWEFTATILKSMVQELWDIRYLSLAHAVGLFAAYQGLVQGRVALVQAIKATEPLIAMMMSGIFYQQYPKDFRIVVSVMIVVTGTICVLVEDTTFTYQAMMWTFISSFTTQGRNQIMKHRQKKGGITNKTMVDTGTNTNGSSTRNGSIDSSGGGEQSSSAPSSLTPSKTTLTSTAKSPAMVGLLMFISTSAAAFIMNIMFLILQFAIQAICSATGLSSSLSSSSSPPAGGVLLFLLGHTATATATTTPFPTYHVIMAGIYHFAYNMASFAVLSLVDMPTTHSLANTAKRAVIIGIAAWQLQEPLTKKASIGLLFVIGGSAGYGYYSKLDKATQTSSSDKNRSTTTTTTPAAALGMHYYNSYSDMLSRYYLKHLTLVILALVVFFQTKNISSALSNYSTSDNNGGGSSGLATSTL